MKSNSRYNVPITLALLTVICLVLAGFSLRTQLINSKEPLKIDAISAENFKKNAIVSDEVYAVIDCYGEEYYEGDNKEKNQLVNYYLVPVGDEEYTTVMIKGSAEIAKYETLMNATQAWIMEEADDINANPVKIEGKVIELDEEMKGYLYEWCEKTEWFGSTDRAEIDKYLLSDFAIEPFSREKETMLLALFAGLSVVFLIATIISFVVVKSKIDKENAMNNNTLNGFGGFPAQNTSFPQNNPFPTPEAPAQSPEQSTMPGLDLSENNNTQSGTTLDGKNID